jgi:ketosteroid isomerase-like protein
MAEEDLERLKAVYAELEKGNLRAGFELFAPDVSYEPIADGRETLSREGSVRFMREFVAQWDDFRIEAKEFEQLGDTILVTERQSGTGRSSRIDIDMKAYAAWTFRDGLVTRARWSLDRDDALDGAGRD